MTNEKEKAPERIWYARTKWGMVPLTNGPSAKHDNVEYVRADLLATALKEAITKVKAENPPHNAGNEFARGFARAKKTIVGQLEAALTEK